MDEYETFPEPLKTGGKCNFFRCTIPGCPYQCRTYRLYNAHVEQNHECEDCRMYVFEKKKHDCKFPGMRGGHVDKGKTLELGLFKEYSRAHKGTLITYINIVDPPNKHIDEVFDQLKPSMVTIYQQLFGIYEGIFTYTASKVIMERESDGEFMESPVYFRSQNHRIFNSGEAEDSITAMMHEIQEKIVDFVMNGSGWRVKTIENVELKVGDLQYFANANGKRWLEMPFKKYGYLNIRNVDNNCFVYCICAALHQNDVPAKSNMRQPNLWKKFIHLHDFSDVWNKQIDIHKDIDAFELKNSINVNVFSNREKHVIPIRRSKQAFEIVVNLFLIEETRENDKLYHYVLITDLDKFLSSCNTKGKSFCQYCYREFRREEDQIIHSSRCRLREESAITEELWPEDWQRLKFTRYEMTLPFPYILFYDFETYLTPKNTKKGSSTTIDAEYSPASFSLVIVQQGLTHPSILAVEYYDGPNVMEKFYELVFLWGQKLINQVRATNNSIVPTQEILQQHQDATNCFLCGKEFSKPTNRKRKLDFEDLFEEEKPKVVKTFHHNHHTGEYIGALCQGCNLKVKYKSELVCVSHNGTGFDHHLLVQALDCPLFDSKDIHVIAKNSERYIQVTLTANNTYVKPVYNPHFDFEPPPTWLNSKVRLRFIDSCRFLTAKLSVLTENLRKENSPFFSLVKEAFPTMLDQRNRTASDEDLQFLLRKLDYAYSYLTSPKVLEPGHPIPAREFFNNDLTGEDITDEDYNTMLTICERFNITDFKTLTRLYCCLDTVLLSVVWEQFRKRCIDIYDLDPTYVATISSFAWNAFLYQTRANVEYITDPGMLELVSSGIRGGPCFATQKIVTANNERTPLGFDPEKPRTHIVYFDVVSLYSHALCGKFPQGDYAWVDVKDLEKIDWAGDQVGSDDIGYILKVDLEYCHNLHDRTSSLPLAPMKKVVQFEELSTNQKNQVNKLGAIGKSFVTQPKLMSDCSDKLEYVVHYDTLRFYLHQGLKLKKIHCGFKFTEKPYFRKYISDNTERRKKVTTKTDRDLLKLCNNSIYGRTLMSNKNFYEIKFCRTRVDALEYIASPFLRDFKILKPNLSMIMLQPKVIEHNNIVQAGFTVLEHAKKIYYEGFHVKLRDVFGDRITNLYNDTDSSVCLVTDNDNTFFDDLAKYKHYFDWSKIPRDSEIFKTYPECYGLNESESGLWKIESINISEGIFLKAKQYSIKYFDGIRKFFEMKCKGMNAGSLQNSNHEDYRKVLLDQKVVCLPMKCISSLGHHLYKITVDKIAFHYLDVNRVHPDSSNINLSYPFFHHALYNCKCLENVV